MTKADIVEKVSEKTGFTKVETDYIFNTILDIIKNSLEKGDRIEIRGFGTFKIKTNKTRQARNPKTGNVISVLEKKSVHFKTGKILNKKINSNEG